MRDKSSGLKNLILISQVSINVMVPIFLCLAIGLWLDKKLDTWFTIPMLILGICAGARNAYVLVMNTVKIEEKKRKKALEDEINRKVSQAKESGDKDE